MRLTVLTVALGCSGPVDWVVDATGLAAEHPDAPFVVELFSQGELLERIVANPVSDAPISRREGLMTSGQVYGVRGWADLDEDGVCDPRSDGAWLFQTFPSAGRESLWEVVLDDPQRSSIDGCLTADLEDLVEDPFEPIP